ncbi:MAG: hypothetical protein IEMM0002_0536 [bacterium]|nr:MAG: hypothetical protein IEMM0002_0536 [bacterium]
MKILYIFKREPDETARKIMEEHKKSCEVSVVNLAETKDYNQIIDLIASSDKIISW